MEINFKNIGNEYAEQVINLILNIQQKEFNIPISIDDQPDLQQIENFYLKNGGNFWGAFLNGELIGTIALVKFSESQGAIRKMFVKKEFRGKELNIAQKLLEILISYCCANGIKEIFLGTVSVLEAAQRFYERNGFIKIDKERLPATFPLMNADTIFYALNLNDTP